MATIRPTSVPTKRLSSAITSAASSFQLTNITGWDGADLTSASFGTKAYGVFRDSTNANIELFEFDPSTIANASITILLRGLKFDGDLTTEVSANKRSWTKGTLVELGTHVPQLFRNYVDTLEAQTIAGVKTFSALPATTAGNPVADNDLVRKAYADAILAGGSGVPNRLVVAGNGGETITAGQLLYLNVADGEWYKCDADTAATIDNIILGLAQGAGTNGNPITNGVLLYGLDSNQSGLTNNTTYYASNTAGGISTTVGTFEVTVGVARSTTSILFYPRYNQVLTERQQDFLDLAVDSTEWYATTSTGNDSYAITVSPAITAYASGQRFRFKTDVANTGAATLAVSGLAAKTIKKLRDQDLVTGDIEASQIVEVVYDGTNFQMVSPSANPSALDYQVFTSGGTWTKPSGLTGTELVYIQAWGAGGGGGGVDGNVASQPEAGGGGGGGGYAEAYVRVSALGSTETVTVGTAGTGGTAGANDGAAGGNTTFGSFLTAYGGGGGAGRNGPGGTGGGGGGGGGNSAAGASGSAGTGGAGGGLGGGAANNNASGDSGGAGGASVSDLAGFVAYRGGGSGASGSNGGSAGGASIFGGGGGSSGTGAGGTSKFGGAGGGGVQNATGAAGTQPGGGGSGAMSTTNTDYAGGAGGAGEVRVWVIK